MALKGVAITGMGLVTPLGPNLPENLANIKAGTTGVKRLEDEGRPEHLAYAGRVDEFPPQAEMNRKLLSQMKFLNKGSTLGFYAAKEAVESSGIDLEGIGMDRRALYTASGDFTNIDHAFLYPAIKDATGGKFKDVNWEKLNSSTLNKVNPFFLLESIANNMFSFMSAYFKFMGPNTCVASLSPCGSNALELAAKSIAEGRADVALAVGCGSWITGVSLFELDGLGVLSSCRRGAESFKPFDARRDGFIPGEGGAAILLEQEEKAEARGAKILGRVKGLGNLIEHTGGKSFAIPEGVNTRSIAYAMEDAGVGPEGLSFIIPHGSATKKGDHSELGSIAEVLGDAKGKVPVCGLKPYTGHMGAASDVAEIIVGVEALREKTVPATPYFERADPEFSELKISSSPQPCAGKNFLSISYGVGGQSSTVVIEVG